AVCAIALMMLSGPGFEQSKADIRIASDGNGKRDLLPPNAPVVLKLNISGVIGQRELTYSKVQNLLLDSQEGMLAHNRVKAIFLYIDSPGGTVTDSVSIYESIKAYKEKYQIPVYAFIDGMCASGGMYIACAADRVFATSSSVIGSVGVILGPAFNFSGLMDRYGVQSLTLTEGKDKDMLNPFRPWQPGEDTSLRDITSTLYEAFVNIVAAARPRMDKKKLIDDYGAQVFVAAKAEELGYIDQANANYESAMQELAKAAQFSSEQPYQVFELMPPHTLLSDLTNNCSKWMDGKVIHTFQIGPFMHSDLSGKFLYLYQPAIEMH
ncbi:MAG: S49 family peptidase, partial [Chlamydiales bacterium]|nr:S49 family peptidase [Chlamydiales bacterium]